MRDCTLPNYTLLGASSKLFGPLNLQPAEDRAAAIAFGFAFWGQTRFPPAWRRLIKQKADRHKKKPQTIK